MITSLDSSLGAPTLAEAIDRYPLIVSPDVHLSEVAALMHTTAHATDPHTAVDPFAGARSSCVLVMQDQQLLGIFTERDLVQLTALQVSLQTTCISSVMHFPVLSMTESSLHNVFAALFLFRRHRIRHLAIVNDSDQLVGVISLDSIRHILRPANLLKIRRVSEVMTDQVVTALPSSSIVELTELMATHQISCVVIVEPGDILHPVGMITERDIVQFQARGLDLDRTQARTVMSTPLAVLSPEDSLWTAHQEMEQRQVRRLVVSWNWGQNLGIITQTNLLRVFDPIEMHDVIETLQRTIQQLGLDPQVILANSINHDTHLPSPVCHLNEAEAPNIHTFLASLHAQLEYLTNYPDLTPKARQAVLLTALSELQQFRHSLPV